MGRHATHHTLAFQPSTIVFSDAVSVFLTEEFSSFSVLQSRIHEVWAKFLGSSIKDDPRYIPEDCFETFPFPANYESDAALQAAGQTYHDHRAALMVEANKGMTTSYNHFHDVDERSPAVQALRDLHDEMDRAVLRAYGWEDLAGELRSEFLTKETEGDHTYQGRYFWPAAARDRVLARLLALNAERHAEEVAAGRAPAAQEQDDDAEGEGAGPLFDRD
jgi:hypothetical protein